MGCTPSTSRSVSPENRTNASLRRKPNGRNIYYTKNMSKVHSWLIGEGLLFHTPYGEKRVLYLDYTASGRSTTVVEDYMRQHVLPCYANVHTQTGVCAKVTSGWRQYSRDVIKQACGANDDDALIYTGSGVTGAVYKLISVLKLSHKPENTVVIIGPYEHHSNILPWREWGAKVITINQTPKGSIDLSHLEQTILENGSSDIIGSFSAASNVTGILTDVPRVTKLLKKYGALSLWDYATAGSYVDIDMNAAKDRLIDAVFISPHKFIGGPQTPGILIAKKALFINKVPTVPGGGTVAWVNRVNHEYLEDIEAREEGGTPPILESIRAAMAFKLKEFVGVEQIWLRDHYLYETARDYWTSNCPNLFILGGDIKRLPIFSLIVKDIYGQKLIHHNFIAALLNDLFGIQTRGGCACAGPYGLGLLGLENDTGFLEHLRISPSSNEKTNDSCYCESESCDHTIRELMKPGWCRLNLPFTMTADELNFVLEAVEEVVTNGWKLLPEYTFNIQSSAWKHREYNPMSHHLYGVNFNDIQPSVSEENGSTNSVKPLSKSYFKESLTAARKRLNRIGPHTYKLKDIQKLETDVPPDKISFLAPEDAYGYLTGGGDINHNFLHSDLSLNQKGKPKKPITSLWVASIGTGENKERMMPSKAMTLKLEQNVESDSGMGSTSCDSIESSCL